MKERFMSRLPPTTTESDEEGLQLDDVVRCISREIDLIHLCARGARIPTMKMVLGKVSEGHIKEVYRLFHGERRGAKARSLDFFTETVERRKDSSAIVGLYRKLTRESVADVATYVMLHSKYLAERSVDPAFDIDELIHLVCAVESGDLKVNRCPNCGSVVVMSIDEIGAEKHCPLCGEARNAKSRIRQSTADPVVFPSEERIKQVIDMFVTPMRNALELVRCGARPPEVEQYVPGYQSFARKLWPAVLGKPAPQGPLPFNSLFYVEKGERRRQTAFVIKLFARLKKSGLTDAELVLTLYRAYQSAFHGSPEQMHFSRIRGIIHFYLMSELRLVRCPKCRTSYVILKDELFGEQACPCCKAFSIAQEDALVRKTVQRSSSIGMIPPLPGDQKRRRLLRKSSGENAVLGTRLS